MKTQTDMKIEYTGMTKVDCNNNNGSPILKVTATLKNILEINLIF